MNKILFVQVHNKYNPPRFSVRFSPYNSRENSCQCSINIMNLTDHYIYSIGVNEISNEFYFIGELINDQHGIFIGVIRTMNQDQSNICNCNYTYSIEYIYQYKHQEYFILDVLPNDHYAYGFSNEFIFIYDTSNNQSKLECWNGNLTWPNDSFMPHAVDLTNHFGIITGFILNISNEHVKYIPIIYLLNLNSPNNHPIIIDEYIPDENIDKWEDFLTNSDENIYLSEYDMSVSINQYGYILVGIQYINEVFIFQINILNPNKLICNSKFKSDRSIRYGKSVTWLDNGNMAGIIVNLYTFDNDWEKSQISIYDMKSNIYDYNSKPLSIFPNYHQKLPKKFHPIFIHIISSLSISLALIDNDGNILIFLPTLPGFFPSIPYSSSSMPLITYEKECLPGTYKNQTGIHDCILCPTHTKNPGYSNTICIPCLSSSFCPLGSSGETNLALLSEVISSLPYPISLDTSFDNFLLNYIFGITQNNCHFSPALFLTLIVGLILFLLIIPIMFLFKYSIKNSYTKKSRKHLKCILKALDVINEGNYWLGGLLSIVLITLIICTFIFSMRFVNSYPIENTSSSYLSCNNRLINAIFQSSTKSSGIPQMPEEQKMIDLLDKQNFTLNIQLINTLINCNNIIIQFLFGTTWLNRQWSDCFNINSTLSIFIPLPHQHISVKVHLTDIQTIGGLRIGLHGNQSIDENYNVKKLQFYKSYYQDGYLLGKTNPVSLILTKVINETVSMDGGLSTFSGIFIPSCKFDSKNILLSSEQYILSTTSTISLQISITESSYYEKNLQQPMAGKSQVIFYTILWIFVCLDLFQFLFLLYKLLLKPLFKYFHKSISIFTIIENHQQSKQVVLTGFKYLNKY